ncbi:MAG: MarR family transcriptional regulator [Burkholderiales bacterium]
MTPSTARLESFCWELRRAFRELARAADNALAPLGIEAGDRALLEMLARQTEPVSISDLARRYAVSRQHVHQALARLPDPDWVERVAADGDRRRVLLRLSRSGRAHWRRIRSVDAALLARLAPAFEPRAVADGIALLQNLRAALGALEGSVDDDCR